MKIKRKEVKVTIPVIMSFSDYHEIDYVLDHLNEIFGGKMKAEELGCMGDNEAIFFFKKDAEYRSLVKEWKARYKEEYDDEG